MNEEVIETETLETEQEAVAPESTEVVEEQETEVESGLDPKTLLAQKEHFRKKVMKLEEQLKNSSQNKETKAGLEVEDFIDISASLEGLDQREKEKLAKEHKLTGKPLSEIRKDEDFVLWQDAYRAKVEKERLALKPDATQSESDRPTSFAEKLKGASMEEKERMLTEKGMYKENRPRADRVEIRRG